VISFPHILRHTSSALALPHAHACSFSLSFCFSLSRTQFLSHTSRTRCGTRMKQRIGWQSPRALLRVAMGTVAHEHHCSVWPLALLLMGTASLCTAPVLMGTVARGHGHCCTRTSLLQVAVSTVAHMHCQPMRCFSALRHCCGHCCGQCCVWMLIITAQLVVQLFVACW